MKLAEALIERADLSRKINSMQSRIQNASRVVEGEDPTEDADELVEELNKLLVKFENLIVRINDTNQNTVLADGMTITQKIVHRDILRTQCGIMNTVVNDLYGLTRRRISAEIRIINTVDAKTYRKKAEQLNKELKEINATLQEANWTIDLCE